MCRVPCAVTTGQQTQACDAGLPGRLHLPASLWSGRPRGACTACIGTHPVRLVSHVQGQERIVRSPPMSPRCLSQLELSQHALISCGLRNSFMMPPCACRPAHCPAQPRRAHRMDRDSAWPGRGGLGRGQKPLGRGKERGVHLAPHGRQVPMVGGAVPTHRTLLDRASV